MDEERDAWQERLTRQFPQLPVLAVSAVTGYQIEEMKEDVYKRQYVYRRRTVGLSGSERTGRKPCGCNYRKTGRDFKNTGGKSMIKLIASDLDGTLLQNGSQVLPDGICDQIRRLKEKGILFAAASGRQYANLRRLFAPVQDDIAYICENGCLVFYQGKLLYLSLIHI